MFCCVFSVRFVGLAVFFRTFWSSVAAALCVTVRGAVGIGTDFMFLCMLAVCDGD